MRTTYQALCTCILCINSLEYITFHNIIYQHSIIHTILFEDLLTNQQSIHYHARTSGFFPQTP
ncbi:hypothetical protein HanXRQr2_Chr16g0773801 [Helianthus annuus]|uniref:Uncharacterized protein n=1 Tax=Helianthus annuus TaxID=4232 RepID=A0A9K3DW71_HELAN|nr:hypothetical protein HanXRQr2_Chr16g0773801 [Helianthus annuus]